VIQNVRKSDAGVYVCELANSLGQASDVLRLVVQQLGSDADGMSSFIAFSYHTFFFSFFFLFKFEYCYCALSSCEL
jgi:hypothetical protein